MVGETKAGVEDATLARRGKVKDVYSLPANRLLFYFSDRVSAFDVVLPSAIPRKGEVLCKFGEFWFNELGVPNHFIALANERKMVVRKLDMVMMECVVRGYLYGSLFERVKRGEVILDSAPELASKLPHAIFDPTTKSETKDQPITKEAAVASGIVGDEEFERLRTISISLYEKMVAKVSSAGFLIADVKFEFGRDEAGNLLLADSLGPDEFRLWSKERYSVGKVQESYDKQLVRDWLIDTGYKKKLDDALKKGEGAPRPPNLPADLVQKVSQRYITSYELITGRGL